MSADTTWPAELTRTPRVTSLEENAPDVVIRSEVDVGPAKIRRRFTGDLRRFSVELDLRRSELAVFDAFFLSTTKGGSLSFSWKLPRHGALADFRFLSVPVYRPLAPRADGTEWWRVSFNVEMLPGTDSTIPQPPGGGGPPGGGTFHRTIAVGGSAPTVSGDSELDGTAVEGGGDDTGDGDEAIIQFIPRESVSPPPEFWLGIFHPPYGSLGDEQDGDGEFDDVIVHGDASSQAYFRTSPGPTMGGGPGGD